MIRQGRQSSPLIYRGMLRLCQSRQRALFLILTFAETRCEGVEAALEGGVPLHWIEVAVFALGEGMVWGRRDEFLYLHFDSLCGASEKYQYSSMLIF